MVNSIQKSEPQEHLSPLQHIDRQIARLLRTELELDQGWANVGLLLQEVSEKEYWRHEFPSFHEYLEDLGERHRKARTQLYAYMSTVKALKPFATPAQLNEMGISKASEFRKALKQGITPPTDALEAALKPSNRAEDIRQLLWVNANPQNGQIEKGTYHDLGAVYCDSEQWLVITSARDLAWKDPEHPAPEGPEFARTLDWLLKLSMEYLGGPTVKK